MVRNKRKFTRDLTLPPFLKLHGFDVIPVKDDRDGRVSFEIPDEAAPFVRDFYEGNPTVELPAYLTELKRVKALVFSMRD
jgi:hypothetical protein